MCQLLRAISGILKNVARLIRNNRNDNTSSPGIKKLTDIGRARKPRLEFDEFLEDEYFSSSIQSDLALLPAKEPTVGNVERSNSRYRYGASGFLGGGKPTACNKKHSQSILTVLISEISVLTVGTFPLHHDCCVVVTSSQQMYSEELTSNAVEVYMLCHN